MSFGTEITGVEEFILQVPVTGSMIKDSMHTVIHWGVIGAKVRIASG